MKAKQHPLHAMHMDLSCLLPHPFDLTHHSPSLTYGVRRHTLPRMRLITATISIGAAQLKPVNLWTS